jgi:hypothetical protein
VGNGPRIITIVPLTIVFIVLIIMMNDDSNVNYGYYNGRRTCWSGV